MFVVVVVVVVVWVLRLFFLGLVVGLLGVWWIFDMLVEFPMIDQNCSMWMSSHFWLVVPQLG